MESIYSSSEMPMGGVCGVASGLRMGGGTGGVDVAWSGLGVGIGAG